MIRIVLWVGKWKGSKMMKRAVSLSLTVILVMAFFVPNAVAADYVTRQDAAKDLVYLSLQHDFTDQEIQNKALKVKNQQLFSDLEEDPQGYITLAAQLDLFDGYPGGMFKPQEYLTETQAVKLLVCALGYQSQAEEMGGYPDGYLAVGKEIGLMDQYQAEDERISQKDFDLLMDTALDLPTMVSEDSESAATLQTLRRNGSFAQKLLEKMPEDQNYMVSPFSIKMALAMLANGAEGETLDELVAVAGFRSLEEYNDFVKETMQAYSMEQDVAIEVANSIWHNIDYYPENDHFKQEFQQVILDCFDGQAEQVTADQAVKTINDWIAEKTNGKITDVLTTSDFLGVLVNTIYFKGQWQDTFQENRMEKNDFTSRDGSVNQIDFMHKTAYFDYYEDQTMQMVRLPYQENHFSMYIALPKTDGKLRFDYAFEHMGQSNVQLSMPKFKIEYNTMLKDVLRELGVVRGFEDNAQFDRMFENTPVSSKIDNIIHKTMIEVNERGTVAAAATAAMMAGTGAPMETVEMKVNRPFTYLIRDDLRGEILFMGEYAFADTTPSKEKIRIATTQAMDQQWIDQMEKAADQLGLEPSISLLDPEYAAMEMADYLYRQDTDIVIGTFHQQEQDQLKQAGLLALEDGFLMPVGDGYQYGISAKALNPERAKEFLNIWISLIS